MSKTNLALLQPVDALYSSFKGLYRTGLLGWINMLRATQKKDPVDFPAVGATQQEVVWQKGAVRLIRYGGEGERKTPLLIVPSLINRHYILDLLPERSVVRGLRAAGLDVYVLDWGSALPADRNNGLAHYALRLLPEAAERIGRPAHVMGYCMGGTLALGAIATGKLDALSLVAMATPVDCDHGGILTSWTRTESFKAGELVEGFGNVPAYILQPAFKMMDPMGLVQKFVHAQQKVTDDNFCRFFLAMETWLEDNVPFPGRAFQEWIEDVYKNNAVMRGTWKLDGERVDLSKVRCPVLSIVAEEDYICPPRASDGMMARIGSTDKETIRMPGGHIGLTTGSSAQKNLWPRVAKWLLQRAEPPRPTTPASSTTTTSKPPRARAAGGNKRRASA
ncbi:MAG: alpha/beta fold hydrolase [Myxococcota bacterium]